MSRQEPIQIFVSYSHLDREWFRKLEPLLKFQPAAQLAHVWHDNELKAGDRWDQEIKKALDRMDIFLCLLSYHFLASDYILEVEEKQAFRREKGSQTVIVPLMICDMDEADITKYKPFNPLPAWGRSWRSFEQNGGHSIDAHMPIRKGLREAIEKVRGRRRP